MRRSGRARRLARRRDNARTLLVTFGMAAMIVAPLAVKQMRGGPASELVEPPNPATLVQARRVLRWAADGARPGSCAVAVEPVPSEESSR